MTILKRSLAMVALLTMAMATPVMAIGHGGSIREVAAMTGATYAEVDPVSHGAMPILNANRDIIRATTAEVMVGDVRAERLLTYMDSQLVQAWYGVVPYSLDEASPFHRPMHGYLAALQAMVFLMETDYATNPQAAALTARLDAELANSLSVCSYSAETFRTDQKVGVEWGKTLTHLPTLGMLGFMGLLLAAVGTEVAVRRRTPGGTETAPALMGALA